MRQNKDSDVAAIMCAETNKKRIICPMWGFSGALSRRDERLFSPINGKRLYPRAIKLGRDS
jgi:hypothetical protein